MSPSKATEYKTALAKEISEHKGIPDAKSSAWTRLDKLIDESVLDDAQAQSESVKKTLEDLLVGKVEYQGKVIENIKIVQRSSAKKFKRFEAKKAGDAADAKFKSQSDILALRIMCDRPQHIMPIMDYLRPHLQHKHSKYGGGRGGIRDRFNSLDSEGNIATFSINADSYWPDVGYMIELQIGLEVAAYIFDRNSLLRDHPHDAATKPKFSDSKVKLKEHAGFDLFKEIKSQTIADQSLGKKVHKWFHEWNGIYGKSEQSAKDEAKMAKMLTLYWK